MVNYILFVDVLRQEEINTFYDACQMHRQNYKGYPKSRHPLTYFRESQYMYQCPADMTSVYLNYSPFHIKYKHPVVLPNSLGCTIPLPDLPKRTLAGRFNKPACKAFVR